MPFCLGRLPHSPERLARGLMAAPAPMLYRYQLDRSAIDYQPGLFGNGTIPDCTCAGVANAAIASGLLRSAAPVIADGKPQRLYADVIGQPNASDAQLAQTNGAVAIAGLMCNRALGVSYLGIRLYQKDIATFGEAPWTAAIADSGAMVGGHVLLAWDYPVGLSDTNLARLATWGALQPASWAWLMERLDEAHGLEWPQLKGAA